MGCASVPMRDGGILVNTLMRHLRPKYLSHEVLRVAPRHPVPRADAPADVRPIVPALLKAYLRLGAWICGEPCVDEDFGVADIFVLLDVRNLDRRYARHFMRRDSGPQSGTDALAS
jgi:putative hemolysin